MATPLANGMNETELDDKAYHKQTMRGLGRHTAKLAEVFGRDGYEVLYYDSEGNYTHSVLVTPPETEGGAP